MFCKSEILIFIFAENNYSIYAHTMLIKRPLITCKLLALCDNANQGCQKAMAPIREKGTIDYLKACRNLGLETQKMQMVAETIAAALRKGNKGCFTCGNKNHLKRDSPKKA